MGRASIAAICVLFATLIIFAGFRIGAESPWGNIAFNLGTEIIGIGFTIAIIDALFERRKSRENAARFSRLLLSEIGKFVKDWLGDEHDLSIDEMLAFLRDTSKVSERTYSVTKLRRIGKVASSVLELGDALYKSNSSLKVALESLSAFATIGDDKESLLASTKIAERLCLAIENLVTASDTKLLF